MVTFARNYLSASPLILTSRRHMEQKTPAAQSAVNIINDTRIADTIDSSEADASVIFPTVTATTDETMAMLTV